MQVVAIDASLDLSGTGELPPSLASRTLVIRANGYEAATVPAWDRNPLEVVLQVAAKGKR